MSGQALTYFPGWNATMSEDPRPEIDSVIGSASGYPITAEFLGEMRLQWF
jgi:hypothetical protein